MLCSAGRCLTYHLTDCFTCHTLPCTCELGLAPRPGHDGIVLGPALAWLLGNLILCSPPWISAGPGGELSPRLPPVYDVFLSTGYTSSFLLMVGFHGRISWVYASWHPSQLHTVARHKYRYQLASTASARSFDSLLSPHSVAVHVCSMFCRKLQH
jgi:hypothetical protein